MRPLRTTMVKIGCAAVAMTFPMVSLAARQSNAQMQQEINLLKNQSKMQQREIALLSNKISQLAQVKHSNTHGTTHQTSIAHGRVAVLPPHTSALRGQNAVAVVPNPPIHISPHYTGKPHTAPPKSGVKDKHGHWHSYFPVGTALYIRKNYNNFYHVVTQNGPKSYGHQFCIDGYMCFSGQANFDLRYYDHSGDFIPGSVVGVGIRPLFGPHDQQILGSINNADLFVDAGINHWVNAHMDLAYVNASQKVRTHAENYEDWGSVYRPSAALKVNEAYLLFANPAATPLFMKIGRFNLDFGDYNPYPMVDSLTQLISQIRTGGVEVGAAFPSGIYGDVSWSMAQQSIENLNLAGSSLVGNNKDRNFGARIGFRHLFQHNHHHVFVNANVSYVSDIRDADYLASGFQQFNYYIRLRQPFNTFFPNGYYYMARAGGIAAHVNIRVDHVGLGGDYVTALKRLNPDSSNSQISAWGVNASLYFSVLQHSSVFELGYQQAKNADVYGISLEPGVNGIPIAFAPPIGAVLPRNRIEATYSVLLLPQISASFQWVHDTGFKEGQGGTGKTSNLATVRLSADL